MIKNALTCDKKTFSDFTEINKITPTYDHTRLRYRQSDARFMNKLFFNEWKDSRRKEMILKLIIVASCLSLVSCGCREKKQESNPCESICHKDDTGEMTCELRGAIILPDLPNIVASRQRVRKQLNLPFLFFFNAKRFFLTQDILFVRKKWQQIGTRK